MMDRVLESDLIPVDAADAPEAQRILRTHNISLKPNELIRLCELLGRNPTLVELHIFNTMWSEHCSYKSSKPVLRQYLPTSGPHVVLGPGEDAGIIRFARIGQKSYCLVMAHESHNHPSQILPVEGAATGIGGIVRDVYCMGADVVGVMDPLRFGDPDGPSGAKVREIAQGVVDGIAQYANALGVPNLGGDTVFDSTFDDNCLVNVVALGIVEESEIVRSRVPPAALSTPHNILLVGKPTDASGFGGAAFASERLSGDEQVESQEAVQVPDPFLKRVLSEGTKTVLDFARRKGIEIGFKDLGAGGISCAVSEMAAAGAAGVVLELDKVNCASGGMPSEIIACSETQERYAMVVPASVTGEILRIYNRVYELPGLYAGAGAFVIGRVTQDGRFKLLHKGKVVCDADAQAITSGIEYAREAKERKRKTPPPLETRNSRTGREVSIKEILITLLSRDNVADKELIFRHYDTEVQGRAVLRPGEADAAVQVFIPGEAIGLVAAAGGNSRLAAVDPYLGGAWAVCEAVRNVACVGGTPLAITDCLNYGDPEDAGVFWEFTEGVRGIGDACRELKLSPDTAGGIPVISGNVSFYNQSERGEPIAPSPVVACAGRVEDADVCMGQAFKRDDSKVLLLGNLHDRTGGSELEMLEHEKGKGRSSCTFAEGGRTAMAPQPDYAMERLNIKALIAGFEHAMILAAHDISQGGLLCTVSEMTAGSSGGLIGCELDFSHGFGAAASRNSPAACYLFSEYGGMVVEAALPKWDEFRSMLEDLGATWSEIGSTRTGGGLHLRLPGGEVSVTGDEIASALKGRLGRIFGSLE